MKIKAWDKLVIFSSATLLVVLVVAAFIPSFDNQFVKWDDQYYVTANPLINNPSWKTLQELLNKVVSLNFHPLTMVSLWLNATISGVETARPFIITNVIIHALNTLLVWLLSNRLSDRSSITAFFTALIFAIHPMHVESVVWVSERKDVLYAFFFLSSLLVYWNYLKDKLAKYLVLCVILFVFACLSKAMAVSLIPCLFLLDYFKSRNLFTTRLYFEKIPFIILALLIGYTAIDIQGGGSLYGLLSLSESANAMEAKNISTGDSLLNSSFANFYYLKNFFLPTSQSAFHPYSMKAAYNPVLYMLVTFFVIGLLILAIKNNWSSIAFGIAFYLATIALVLQFLPVGSALVAERYTYLPYIGLAFIAGTFLQNVWNEGHKFLVLSILLLLCYFMTIRTRMQSDVWQDHTTLFQKAVEVYPDDPFSRKALANGLWDNGKLNEAIHHTKYAINELGLTTSSAFELLANCYSEKGEKEKAIAFFNEAIRLDSTNVIARYHRGLELLEIDPNKAIIDFNFCEESNNEYVKPLLYSPRGRAFGISGNYQNALTDLNKAIELFPTEVNNYLDKAITLEKLKRFEEAKQVYSYVLSLSQNEPFALERLKILKTSKIHFYES